MKLILIYGPPGVGKLTVARTLEKSIGFKLLYNHLIADLIVPIFGFRTQISDKLNETIRRLVYTSAAKSGLAGIISTFVYYAESNTDEGLRKYVEIIKRFNGEIFFIKLLCDIETLKQRVINPSRLGTKKIVSTEKLEQALQKHNLVSVVPRCICDSLEIDNTNLMPEEVVENIRSYCKV